MNEARSTSPDGSDGPEEAQVRLFPLPNLVLFPHVVQPLHIFEPRYRQLMADSLADDRRFAMALLRPDWERTYDLAPPIFSTVCLGQIHREERLFDGRYNLLLQGLRRARVLEEVPTDRLYRVAKVQWLDSLPLEVSEAEHLQQGLLQLLREWARHHQAVDAVEEMLQSPMSLDYLSDVLAFSLPLPLEIQQELLDEVAVPVRVRRLLNCLTEQIGQASSRAARIFPPRFSEN